MVSVDVKHHVDLLVSAIAVAAFCVRAAAPRQQPCLWVWSGTLHGEHLPCLAVVVIDLKDSGCFYAHALNREGHIRARHNGRVFILFFNPPFLIFLNRAPTLRKRKALYDEECNTKPREKINVTNVAISPAPPPPPRLKPVVSPSHSHPPPPTRRWGTSQREGEGSGRRGEGGGTGAGY